jgi:hypothetical protein
MLHRGDLVPHFDVRTVGDEPVSYSTIWQRRNLVLVTLADVACDSCRGYVSELTALFPALGAQNTECVITRDPVPGMCSPGVLVADRWGEIVSITEVPDIADLPSPEELLDWVRYVQTQCPECEGEAK